MGLGTTENKIYLDVGYGRLRKKASAPGEGVVERTKKDGEKTYAYEYKYIEGIITGIYYKESKDYGNSFEVIIKDDKVYNISFKENSRYCQDFLSKLPAIDLSKVVRITPFEMLGYNEKLFRGVSVLQDGIKIQNFFVKKEGEQRTLLHGFPKPAAEKLTEKQWKIYCIEMQYFLAQYTINEIMPRLKEKATSEQIEEQHTDNPNEEEDLPF